METFHGIERFSPPGAGITLTVGNFDGVHRGHQHIIETARQVAGQLGTPVVVLTFEPHPLAIVAPRQAPARLTTAEEKLHLLRACDVDTCIVVSSEPALLEQTAETFLLNVSSRCRPRAIVEGADFNFGRGRGGSVQTLRLFADRLGFNLHVVQTVHCEEIADAPAVRSSAIRAALGKGSVDIASAMLGRPHRITGTVSPGAGRGADLGFPTANLDGIRQMLPGEAVYSAVAQFADGSFRLAAVNVGPQPTFGEHASCVEAHVLDWSTALRGQRLGLHLLARLRLQRCFANADELVAQLRRDVAATREHAGGLQRVQRQRAIPL